MRPCPRLAQNEAPCSALQCPVSARPGRHSDRRFNSARAKQRGTDDSSSSRGRMCACTNGSRRTMCTCYLQCNSKIGCQAILKQFLLSPSCCTTTFAKLSHKKKQKGSAGRCCQAGGANDSAPAAVLLLEILGYTTPTPENGRDTAWNVDDICFI